MIREEKSFFFLFLSRIFRLSVADSETRCWVSSAASAHNRRNKEEKTSDSSHSCCVGCFSVRVAKVSFRVLRTINRRRLCVRSKETRLATIATADFVCEQKPFFFFFLIVGFFCRFLSLLLSLSLSLSR
jgi:hypothetical protein